MLQERFADIGGHPEELPDLAVFECNLERSAVCFVRDGFDFRIEDRNGWDAKRRHEVRAVIDLAVTFPAKDHGAKNLKPDCI